MNSQSAEAYRKTGRRLEWCNRWRIIVSRGNTINEAETLARDKIIIVNFVY